MLLDETYVRLVGKFPLAWRDQGDRPWHILKTRERLEAEDNGTARQDEYYMSDDSLKLCALLVCSRG